VLVCGVISYVTPPCTVLLCNGFVVMWCFVGWWWGVGVGFAGVGWGGGGGGSSPDYFVWEALPAVHSPNIITAIIIPKIGALY